MTKDEELLNEIIQRRGYLVVAVTGRTYCSGEMLEEQPTTFDDGQPMDTKAQWYVLAETNSADMRAQQKLVKQLEPWRPIEPLFNERYYRILSD